MRLRAFIIRLIMFVVAAGFLISPAYSADKKAKKSAIKNERGLKVVSKGDGRRIALVIGNGDYKNTGHLANPVNDARLMAETLKEVGFELYGGKPQINLSRDDMLSAIEGFGDRIGKGDTALFYYAGHGMQVRGENYLIPVNANIKNEAEVRVKSVESALLFAKLEGAKNGVNIVILDACRNNPFGRSFRSGNNGLAQVTAPSGTIVAFSTAPNQVAEDGSGGNSTYTRELARFIKSPGLRIEDVFKRVRVSVEETTGGNQQPWENTSLKGDFTFVEGAIDLHERQARAAEERATQAEEKARRAEQQAAEAEEKARQKIAMAPRPQQEPVTTVSKKKKGKPDKGYIDPTTGMQFISVPGGCFQMGDTFGKAGSDAKPVHEVCLSDYLIGKYEVTQAEWYKVMKKNPSKFTGCGERCPVENVSLDDAQEFINKMNEQSGTEYRLPTEAEWEYACRSGGKQEKYCGGNNPDTVAWYIKNSGKTTHKVGTKKPNGLGIYDMTGNVSEWVSDWYDDKYYNWTNETLNPKGPDKGSNRVNRGGDLNCSPEGMTLAAYRSRCLPTVRYEGLGLRLVAPVQ